VQIHFYKSVSKTNRKAQHRGVYNWLLMIYKTIPFYFPRFLLTDAGSLLLLLLPD